MAAPLAAIAILGVMLTAASPRALAAGPFPEEVVERAPSGSHFWAYATLATGATLIGTSFVLAERGNDAYEEYLAATDPDRIDDLFDETERYDRLADGSLITGEALCALGVYLRFLRRPAPMRVSIGPGRCAVAWRF